MFPLDIFEPFLVEVHNFYAKMMGDQKYLPAIMANISPTYLAILSSTVVTVLLTMYFTQSPRKEDNERSNRASNGGEGTRGRGGGEGTPQGGRGILKKINSSSNLKSKKTSFCELPNKLDTLQVPTTNQKVLKITRKYRS